MLAQRKCTIPHSTMKSMTLHSPGTSSRQKYDWQHIACRCRDSALSPARSFCFGPRWWPVTLLVFSDEGKVEVGANRAVYVWWKTEEEWEPSFWILVLGRNLELWSVDIFHTTEWALWHSSKETGMQRIF